LFNKRIIIITGQHLVNNPRTWKEANALSESGYNVTVYAPWYSRSHLVNDIKLLNSSVKYETSFNYILDNNNLFIVIYAKILKRLANILFYIFKIPSIYQQVLLPNLQLKKIIKQSADLIICHQETGLFIGNKLIQNGFNVAFDFEDLYSGDYLNKYRPISLLKNAELFALMHASYITCPSVSMRDVLKKTYRQNSPIHVIYNSFPDTYLIKSSIEKMPNSIVWFSQTLGPGRGIEEFIKALKLVDLKLNIFLIGNVSKKYQKYLVKELGETGHSVSFIPTMSHTSLLEYLLKFQIGLALELQHPLNKDLTLSNKMLLFLQLSLRIIASKTTGQLELKDYFSDQITYVDINDSISFARRIEEELLQLPSSSIYPFNKKFRWDSSKEELIKLVQKALKS
jgi:glycosyltransferase involved in cell wall biosynthesis